MTNISITLHWAPVDCIHRNGNITSYLVQYGVQGNRNTNITKVFGGAATNTTISGLIPATMYSIKVAAVNNAGPGVYSNSTTVRTLGEV